MKIEYTEGCVCYGLDVDGEPFQDLSERKQKQILNKVIDTIINKYGFSIMNIATDLVRDHGEYEFSHHCEDCGDSVCTYTIEI